MAETSTIELFEKKLVFFRKFMRNFYKSRQLHLRLTIKIFIPILLEKSNKHNSSQMIQNLYLKQWVKTTLRLYSPKTIIFILLNVGIGVDLQMHSIN